MFEPPILQEEPHRFGGGVFLLDEYFYPSNGTIILTQIAPKLHPRALQKPENPRKHYALVGGAYGI